jgi:hypothetical protein
MVPPLPAWLEPDKRADSEAITGLGPGGGQARPEGLKKLAFPRLFASGAQVTESEAR